MNLGTLGITFLGIFFAVGFNDHSVNCLIEYIEKGSKETKLQSKFVMEILNKFDRIFEACQDRYKADDMENYDYHNWIDTVTDVRGRYPKMENVTGHLKMEILCVNMIYHTMEEGEDGDPLAIMFTVQLMAIDFSFAFLQGYMTYNKRGTKNIAHLFAEVAAYLAAFAANEKTGNLLYEDLKTYFSIRDPNAGKYVKKSALPYPEYVNEMRQIIYSNYNSVKNNDKESEEKIDLFEGLETLPESLDSYSVSLISYMSDAIFAKKIDASGQPITKRYDYQNLWESTWKSSNLISKLVAKTGVKPVTASGSSLGPSKLTQLLREIEKLNLRILGVKEEEIEEIVQGFGKEATVVVREFDITGLQPFVLFLMRKHQEKQDSHMMLANNKFIQFLENECYKEERLMHINNLEKTFPMK